VLITIQFSVSEVLIALEFWSATGFTVFVRQGTSDPLLFALVGQHLVEPESA